MKRWTIHDAAEVELRQAIAHYEEIRHSLALDFFSEYQTALERVLDNPLMYAADDDFGVRHAPHRRFSYSIVYLDFEDHIWIVAVMHQHRKPYYWATRLPGS